MFLTRANLKHFVVHFKREKFTTKDKKHTLKIKKLNYNLAHNMIHRKVMLIKIMKNLDH